MQAGPISTRSGWSGSQMTLSSKLLSSSRFFSILSIFELSVHVHHPVGNSTVVTEYFVKYQY